MKLTLSQKTALNRAIKHAPLHKVIIALFWAIFKKRKAKELMRLIEIGLYWKYAFEDAKNQRCKKVIKEAAPCTK